MNLPSVSTRAKQICLALSLACLVSAGGAAEQRPSPIHIIKPEISEQWMANLPANEKSLLTKAPANFYHFGAAKPGELTNVQRFTVEFSASATLTRINSSSRDFRIEQEGSCAEGRTYPEGSSCEMVVRFAPQGAGHRLGKLTVQEAGGAQAVLALGGYSYVPVASFVPAQITLVTATYSSGGLLTSTNNIAISGDTLYIANTGAGKVQEVDSSNKLVTLASGYTNPSGIAVDNFGQVYFDTPSTSKMYEVYDYGPVVQVSGAGTDPCPASAPCTLSAEGLGAPGEMSIDEYNHLFFADSHQGAAFSTVQPLPANLIYLYDPFPYQQSPSAAMAVDNGDNLYSLWGNGGVCEIAMQTLYDAENGNVSFGKVAGGHTCGFSGDGGLATNAEIGAKIGQIAFDLAGDLYFSDTNNNRVRRIEVDTGVIRTIAGNGVAGFTGSNSAATNAELASPTGVAVDSQGSVYIVEGTAATGTTQTVRKVGPMGDMAFASTKDATSVGMTVLVSNTGNEALMISGYNITGTNAADFKLNPSTTTCSLTGTVSLYVGQNCVIGVIFKPSIVGLETANMNLLDNTVNNGNTIILTGTGVAAAAAHFTTPTSNASFASTTSVSATVKVTSTNAALPTGTVTFKVDGKQVGSPATLASGLASINLGTLSAGSHTLSASYNGDKYNSKASASESITVAAVAAVH